MANYTAVDQGGGVWLIQMGKMPTDTVKIEVEIDGEMY